jgi:hypothetical protein
MVIVSERKQALRVHRCVTVGMRVALFERLHNGPRWKAVKALFRRYYMLRQLRNWTGVTK